MIEALWEQCGISLRVFSVQLAMHSPSSNVKIADFVGSKTAKQVGMHKRLYLRDHPLPRKTDADSPGNSLSMVLLLLPPGPGESV